MSDTILPPDTKDTTHRVVDAIGNAVGQTRNAACAAGDGIAEFRAAVRGQPVAMSLLIFGLGYVVARLAHPRYRYRPR